MIFDRQLSRYVPILQFFWAVPPYSLIGMCRIPADAMYSGADIVALAIELYISVARAKTLDGVTRRASGLVANE